MENLNQIKKFLSEQTKFEGITFGDENYHYARQISNSRFGLMPAGIAYCNTPTDVQVCVNFCKNDNVPFRIRSGGHQHEGMSSASDALIIDLSKMYGAKIHDDDGKPITADAETAWIPVGMKLEVVYKDLAASPIFKTIPGGGCQSVNLGGLTQGGGWGTSIRKFGLTCDNIDEAELVLADGSILNTAKLDISIKEVKERKERILWALRGGGGGNFGVVTRFKFRLSPLGSAVTTFGIKWDNTADSKKVVKKWIDFQKGLTHNLSCAAVLSLERDKKTEKKNSINARMGGKFYGSEQDLLKLLKTLLGDLAPISVKGEDLKPIKDSKADQYFAGINTNNYSVQKTQDHSLRLVADDQWVADFMSMNSLIDDHTRMLTLGSSAASNIDPEPMVVHVLSVENGSDRSGYTVLPKAPESTCDQPHPHKVTSAFPSIVETKEHHELVDKVYERLEMETFHPDVKKYMVWHCLGGVSDKEEYEKKSAYPFRNKPYLLQLQCWWDNSGKIVNDVGRATEYVKWVNDFRDEILAKETAGAFINFVDKLLVKDISTQENRLKLLKFYYGDSLDQLRTAKKEFDPENLFQFEMSIPPSDH
ncbi:MAG: FAD/FMN-containing dehydrogenase [Crocinitomix sp.]|jgi:FAD/FMN-containing dehydrogenase